MKKVNLGIRIELTDSEVKEIQKRALTMTKSPASNGSVKAAAQHIAFEVKNHDGLIVFEESQAFIIECLKPFKIKLTEAIIKAIPR